ncbi:MAG: hypothetical protein QOJ70_3830, partial [Acidobacteriota bacterium]|nr:hypothetical protein [Acidobacteriota bacterium]
MKQCPTCQEEFADKFGFCPVDGTSLDVAVAPVVAAQASDESIVTASALPASGANSFTASSNGSNGSGVDADATVSHFAAANHDEFHLTFLEDEGLTRRLARQLKEVGHDAELTWPEFKRDPVGFAKRMGVAYGGLVKKFFRQDYAVPAVVAPFCVALIVAGAWVIVTHTDRCFFARLIGRECVSVAANPYENLEIVGYVDPENPIPKEQPTPDKGPAGTNEGKGGGSKPKQEKPGGGGGGGRQEQTPPSAGKLPTAQLEVPPILTA